MHESGFDDWTVSQSKRDLKGIKEGVGLVRPYTAFFWGEQRMYSVGRQRICQSPWLSCQDVQKIGLDDGYWPFLALLGGLNTVYLCQNSRMACFIHSELTVRDSVAAFRGREHSQEKKEKRKR